MSQKGRKNYDKNYCRAKIDQGARLMGLTYETYMQRVRSKNIMLNERIIAYMVDFDIDTFFKLAE